MARRWHGLTWLVPAAGALALGLHLRSYRTFFTDDGFISLRYASRLLHGHGLTWTEGDPVEGYVNRQADQEGVDRSVILDRITSRMAIPEIPQDADVAEAAIFLCSDRARFITGQYLMVNSGELMT